MNTFKHTLWNSPKEIEQNGTIPHYRTKNEVVSYLNNYATHFNIPSNIRFNTDVTSIRYDSTNSQWLLTCNNDPSHTIRTDFLAVATSINRVQSTRNFKN